ncbi:MAG: outer membrane protein assembly factor BamD [Alphaproteobacteria bacterium]
MLFACVSVAACTIEEPAYVEQSVERLYNFGVDALQAGLYKDAISSFDEVERQHPYSVWATKAQLMSAYASYKRDDYDEAIVGVERFIELHPGNNDAPYAYYLKALCYYEQISDVGRDQKMTELALAALDNVIQRYPDSKYGRDARAKIDLVHDHLAGKEMAVGRYYQKRGDNLAAINRYRVVLRDYQTTTHVPEALLRLTENYLALGITDEAQMAAAVLGHNFPGSSWYEDSYALLDKGNLQPALKEGSWLSWMWDWTK